jgi:hypothetical protein
MDPPQAGKQMAKYAVETPGAQKEVQLSVSN